MGFIRRSIRPPAAAASGSIVERPRLDRAGAHLAARRVGAQLLVDRAQDLAGAGVAGLGHASHRAVLLIEEVVVLRPAIAGEQPLGGAAPRWLLPRQAARHL